MSCTMRRTDAPLRMDTFFRFWITGKRGVRGLSFGADHAPKPLAKPTISAPRYRNAIGIRIGPADRSSRNRVRMISECFCGISEQGGKVRNLDGRVRILSAAPAFKDIASFNLLSANITCFARNAQE